MTSATATTAKDSKTAAPSAPPKSAPKGLMAALNKPAKIKEFKKKELVDLFPGNLLDAAAPVRFPLGQRFAIVQHDGLGGRFGIQPR